MLELNRKVGLKSALLLGAATAAAISFSAPAYAAAVETVVVTGSRIPTKDYASNSPVATVQGEAIREIGTSTIETYLNTLPQFTPSLTKTNNNPQGGGAATLDLRNLGPSRTLVLVDSRRVIGSTSAVVDVSIIPSSLIDRVEVVTGGASAVYGSDALAGVVNFILKKDFEGFQVTARGGISGHGDGEEHRIDTIIGANFGGGRGNATFVMTYEKRTGIGEGARAFSANAETCVVGAPITCTRNGSPTTPDGTIVSIGGGNTLTQAAIDAYFAAPAHGGLPAGTATVGEIGFNPPALGSLFYTSAGGTAFPVTNYKGPNLEFAPGNFTYNFNPTNLLQLPFKRFSAYTTAYYQLMPHVEAYATALFTNYSSRTQLAPTPATFTVNLGPACGTGVNCAGGTLPADLVALYTASGSPLTFASTGTMRVARRTNELGPRAGNFDNNVFQVTAGLRGDFAGLVDGTTYNYDVYTSYGRYYGDVFFTGYASGARATAAAGGCPAGSPAGPPGVVCTPLNIFGNNSINAANAAYISQPYYDNALNTLADIQATVTGDAFSTWAGPVGFALGTEYRELFYQDVPDIVLQIGDVQGANPSAVTRGGYNILEGFGEVKVPLLADQWGINYAGVEGGIRYSRYSTGRNLTTLKVGGEIAPWEWFKVRGMYQHAIRAASVAELFSNAQGGFPTFTGKDPCATDAPARLANPGPVGALCAAQAPGAIYNSGSLFTYASNQLYSVSGGNPALAPETENNFTVGFVLRPGEHLGSFLSHFTATVDYYNLRINGVISTVAAATSLVRCYDPAFNPTFSIANAYCAAIHRDPATGAVHSTTQPTGFIAAQNANLGAWKVAGIDADIVFTADLSEFGADEAWGSLMIADTVAYLDRFKIQVLPGEAFTNIAGTIADGTPGRSLASHPAMPNWKNTFRVNWNVGDFSLGWRMYTIGATDNFHPGPDAVGAAITHVPIVTYHYLNGRWNFDDNWSLFGGVDNVMDEQPPRYTAAFQYTVDPSTYDTIGRYFYAGVTVKY